MRQFIDAAARTCGDHRFNGSHWEKASPSDQKPSLRDTEETMTSWMRAPLSVADKPECQTDADGLARPQELEEGLDLCARVAHTIAAVAEASARR